MIQRERIVVEGKTCNKSCSCSGTKPVGSEDSVSSSSIWKKTRKNCCRKKGRMETARATICIRQRDDGVLHGILLSGCRLSYRNFIPVTIHHINKPDFPFTHRRHPSSLLYCQDLIAHHYRCKKRHCWQSNIYDRNISLTCHIHTLHLAFSKSDLILSRNNIE